MESSREKNREREGMGVGGNRHSTKRKKKCPKDFTNGSLKLIKLDRYGFLYFMVSFLQHLKLTNRGGKMAE